MDYESAVELIKDAEASDTEQRSIKVNLVDFNDKIPIREYGSKDVTALIGFVDKVESKQGSGGSASAASAQAEQKQEMQTEQKQEVQAEKKTIPAPPVPVKRPEIMKGIKAAAAELEDAVSQHTSQIRKEIDNATAGIGNGISQAKGRMAKAKESKGYTGKLILPGLSLSDQLSELEKIDFGINGGVFDNAQLVIIKNEVGGLAKSIKNQKARPGEDVEMVELRDKRLKEVLSKLGLK